MTLLGVQIPSAGRALALSAGIFLLCGMMRDARAETILPPPTSADSASPDSASSDNASAKRPSASDTMPVPSAHYGRTTERPPAEAATFQHIPTSGERARALSVEDLANQSPGVFVVRHSSEGKGAQYFVRGFDAQHGTDIELTLEGVPLNFDSHIHGHGYIDLGWLPLSAVSRMDFSGGAYRVDQGPFAMGGSLDIRLHAPALEANHQLSLRTSHFGHSRIAVHSESSHKNLQQSHASELTAGLSWADRRFALRYAGLQRLHWRTARGAQQQLMIAGGVTRYEIPTLLARGHVQAGLSQGHSYLQDLRGQSDNLRLQWHGERRINNALHLHSNAAFHLHRFRYDDNNTGYLQQREGDTRLQSEDRRTLYLSSRMRHRLRRDHQLLWLAGLQYHHSDQSLRWRTPDAQTPPIEQWTQSHHMHGFVGVEWEGFLAPWLRVTSSLRADFWHLAPYEHTLEQGFHDTQIRVSPRASLKARLHETLDLIVAGGMGQRPSEIRAIIQANEDTNMDATGLSRDRFGNGQAQISRSGSVDIGFFGSWDRLQASLSVYGTWMRNESFYDHVAGLTYLLNPSRRLGFDASLEWLAHERVRLQGQWSVVDARFIESGGAVPGAPRQQGYLQAEFGLHPHLDLEVSSRFVGERVLRYDARAGAWAVLDLSLRAQPAHWLTLRASATNLFNATMEEAMYNYPSHWDATQPVSQLPRLHALYGTPRTFWLECIFHL